MGRLLIGLSAKFVYAPHHAFPPAIVSALHTRIQLQTLRFAYLDVESIPQFVCGVEALLRYICSDLRHAPPLKHRRPVVGIVVDGSNTYGRAIVRGITRYTNLQRRWLLFMDLQRFLDEKSDWPDFDGVICAGVPGEVFDRAREKCRHLVYCSGGGNPAFSPVVALDDVEAGKLAAKHLLDCHFEHFAFYGNQPSYLTVARRLAGFRQTVEMQGYTCTECDVPRPTAKEWVSHTHRPALIQWLINLPKPVGIMTFDDNAAHDLAAACLEGDIVVPDQVGIVGVNNDDLFCDSAWPPLTSVDAEYSRVGFKAAEILERLLNGEKFPKDERMILLSPLGVIQRQSTNVQAIKDQNLIRAIRFIGEHTCDPCSVDDVLRVVPVNRRWLERNFSSQLGRTVHDEIARVRIDTAKRLLRGTEFTLDDIAVRCGFAESKRFYVLFRKLTGTTPAAFRRSSSIGSK